MWVILGGHVVGFLCFPRSRFQKTLSLGHLYGFEVELNSRPNFERHVQTAMHDLKEKLHAVEDEGTEDFRALSQTLQRAATR